MGDRVGGDSTTSSQDFPFVIASVPASKQERWLAFGLIAFVWLAFAMVAPFAHVPLARIDAFVPVLQTVMCIVDLITEVLLFAQYSIVPKRALLAVACGYVFSGLFAFLQTLAFPGAYSPKRFNRRWSQYCGVVFCALARVVFTVSCCLCPAKGRRRNGQRVPHIDCDHHRGCPGMHTRVNSRADVVGDGGRGISANHIRWDDPTDPIRT
jgi:Membrane-associated sensor, integral membrane domain